MASTIASQLQAIKTLTLSDSEPLKRPFTRPSIIFDPKEAADIDIDSIFAIALSGKIDSILTSFSGKFFPRELEVIGERVLDGLFVWKGRKGGENWDLFISRFVWMS